MKRTTILPVLVAASAVAAPPPADVHCHFTTAAYLAALEKHGAAMDEFYPVPAWSPEALASFLDEAGIGFAVLTSVAPQPHFGDAAESAALCRSMNDEAARLAAADPERLAWCATLPLPSVDEAVAKLRAELAADPDLAPHAEAILGGNARRLFAPAGAQAASPCQHGQAARAPAIYRIAEIEVKPGFLDAYLAAAATVGATSVREEPGVLCIFPMQDAEKPASIRILEIYRDEAAYKSHLETPHFRAYKEGTPHMIESLRLAPMRPLDATLPPDIFRKVQPPKETIP